MKVMYAAMHCWDNEALVRGVYLTPERAKAELENVYNVRKWTDYEGLKISIGTIDERDGSVPGPRCEDYCEVQRVYVEEGLVVEFATK